MVRTSCSLLAVVMSVFLTPSAALGVQFTPKFLQAIDGQTNTTEPFRMELSNRFTGKLDVGGQHLTGTFDTGSTDLLIFNTGYSHSSSTSYSSGTGTKTHHFASGSTDSQEAYDTVAMGPGLSMDRVPFWEVTSANLMGMPTQAIVGLGRSRAEDGDASKSILTNFDVQRFSVCMGPSNGVLVWNDADPRSSSGAFTQLSHLDSGIHWSVELTNAKMGDASGKTFDLGCSGGCGAVIDTGTTLISAPTDVVNQVDKMLKELGDCSRVSELPDLVFNLGGEEFSLPAQAYVGSVGGKPSSDMEDFLHMDFNSSSNCQNLLMDINVNTQFGPLWILGAPFFTKYYTTFEQGSGSDSIFVAQAGASCEPASVSDLLAVPSDQSAKTAKVHAPSLRVPSWVRDAMSSKVYKI